MADDFSQSVVRLVVAQVCKSVGWESISSSASEVLIDFTERHISHLGRNSRRYAEQFGRVDPTVDDLEMVFNDSGIILRDILEYTKVVEPITLGQPVPEFPAPNQTKNELFIPEIDEDGKVISTSGLTASSSQLNNGLQVNNEGVHESPSAGSRFTNSPVRTPSKISRLAGEVENVRFRSRSQFMMEDGEISDLFSVGKPPSAGRPPKPLHEVNIPKLTIEATVKPKIKTGVLKPTKPKPAPVIVEVPSPPPTPTPEPPSPQPEPVSKPERHKPPKKVEKKKKKKKPVAAQPEGFSDIFGDTLEQPEKPAAKPPKPERRLSVSLEKLPNLTSPTPSFNKQDVMSESEMSAVSDRNITPDLDESNPTVKARLSNWDSTIDSVLADTRAQLTDNNKPPKQSKKQKNSGASKKARSPTRSRSPVSKPKKKSSEVIAVSSEVSPAESSEVSPQPPAEPVIKTKAKKEKDKEKKKKRSRREQLLEKFAAAPIDSFDAPISPAESHHHKPEVPSTPPQPSPPQSPELLTPPFIPPPESSPEKAPSNNDFEDDQEAELVNVDEDSDVDIMEASSPTPPPQNPYSAYVSLEDNIPPAPSTPPLMAAPQHIASPEPMDFEQTHSRNSEESNQWQVYDHTQAPPTWDDNSQSGDYTIPADGEIPFTKKEKHKKEKKEKKEKKKKKHKEKDKEKGEGKHKHKKDKTLQHQHIQEEVGDDEEFDEGSQNSADVQLPKLTLKLGSQAIQDSYNQDPLDLDSSFNTTEDVSMVEEAVVPKLVIKPFGAQKYDMASSSIQEATPPPQTYMPAANPYHSVDGQIPVVEEDGRIWICPACQKPDDGSPMIGCDGCDEWYHWPCVGIVEQPPDDVEWFCATCAKKDKKKKKKRKKEKS